ncbi:MAG TPA: hypothetical protein VLW45_13305 [Pelomicrobium sp.]|nr:hypothetical protein [Pelomicrobium sp.]
MAALASGQAAAAESDTWQFEVTPYLFGARMDGTVGLRGYTTDVDASFDEILDHLDAGFMGLFSARKGPWSFALEGVYMKLEDGNSGGVTGPGGVVSINGQLDATAKMYVYQGTVGYRVLDQNTKVDVLGALRYTELDLDLDVTAQFTPGILFPGGARSVGGSESWTDAVVGARVLHPLSKQVSLLGYVDVGGGGSDLTYQLIAGVDWEFRKDFIARIGYRYLYWDYEDNGTVWDIAASGPYLGLGIRF